MKRKQSLIFSILLAIILFFLDISSFIFLEKPLIASLLCWYIIICVNHVPVIAILLALFLLLLQSFIYYGSSCGLSLIAIIPITLIALQVRHTLYESRWVYYILITLALLIQIIGVEHLGMGLPISIPYTISRIFANIIMMIILRSLK